jgi:soluble lytic murein transglycosylase-like protein
MGVRSRSGVSAILLLAALLGAAPAHATAQWIYIQQREDGITAFTDTKPAHGTYKRIAVHGRQTAFASCAGLTAVSMQQRADSYAPLIRKYASQHGLSPELVSAVMRVESCYDRHAVSRSGARGLMQLMPDTARHLGVVDSFDPDQNIEAGVRFLAQLFRRFGSNVRLALAAYNAGPEAVNAYNDVPPYPETRSYVTRILKLYKPGF